MIQYIFLQIILLPITLVLATPVILIMGNFGKGKYSEKVKKYYKAVIDFYVQFT